MEISAVNSETSKESISHIDYQDNNKQSFWENILFPSSKLQKDRLTKNISGKTILITGASFGIGESLTTLLSDYNVTLILVARTTQKLEELKQKLTDNTATLIIFTTDLKEEASINCLLEELNSRKIEIDIFINNAGKSINRGLYKSLDRFTDTKRCSAINYTGPIQLILGLLPSIIKKSGQIINVSALNVLLPPTAGWSAYQSSKAAFDQWMQCIEPELKVKNVAVSSIYLPLVRTRMSMVNEKNHNRSAMSKEKASKVILNCLATRKRKYKPWWSGLILFFCAIFPNLWHRIQVNYLRKVK